MADAFQVLQTSLGPALAAVEKAANRNVLLGQQTEQRNYTRALIEDQRQYAEQTEQRRRKERKEDSEEERLRQLRVELESLGGDPTNKSEGQIAAEIRQLGIKAALDKTMAMEEGALYNAARMADIPTEGKSRSQIAMELAEKNQDAQVKLAFREEDERVKAARNHPDFAAKKMQYQAALAAYDTVFTQFVAPLPEFNPDLTPQDEVQLGKMLAKDPVVAAEIRSMPNGESMLRNLQTGAPGGIGMLYRGGMSGKKSRELSESIKQAVDNLTAKIQTGKEVMFSAGMRAYFDRVKAAPQMLERASRQIEAIRKDKLFGPALLREDDAALSEEFVRKLKEAQLGASNPRAGAAPEPLPLPEIAPVSNPVVASSNPSAVPVPVPAPVVDPIQAQAPQPPSLTPGQWADRYLWPAGAGGQEGTRVGSAIDRVLKGGTNLGSRIVDIIAPKPTDNPAIDPYLPAPPR